jgi:hypothetical protein
MMLKLQQMSREFSELNDEEKAAVIFSLLAIMLPKVVKEKTTLSKSLKDHCTLLKPAPAF